MDFKEARSRISNISIRGRNADFCKGLVYMRDRAMKYLNQVEVTSKIMVPRCALEWLESNNEAYDLIKLYADIEYSTDSDGFVEAKWPHSPDFYDWLVDDAENIFILADALRCDYEFEKEPKYLLAIPYYGYLTGNKDQPFVEAKEDAATSTESEIKAVDERLWAFAVPVEEEPKC